MKLYRLIFLSISVTIIGCKKTGETGVIEKTNIIESIHNQKTIIRGDTLFLSLSPNMSKTEFAKAINNENGRRLENGSFVILLNNQALSFHVSQRNKGIELNYKQYFSKNELNSNADKDLFNHLIEIFNSKYKFHDYADFPNHLFVDEYTNTYHYFNPENEEKGFLFRRLSEYGFNNTNYAIFNDSLKTIVIGYSTKRKTNIGMLATGDGEPFINHSKNDYYQQTTPEKNNPDDIKWFNCSITIDYFLTNDFDSIKNKILTENTKIIDSLKSKIKGSSEKTKKFEQNKSEL